MSYYEWLLVDVVQVQGQQVVLAAHVHAVVVLVHAQDPVVWRVEQEGEVVGGAGGPQLCRGKKGPERTLKKQKAALYLSCFQSCKLTKPLPKMERFSKWGRLNWSEICPESCVWPAGRRPLFAKCNGNTFLLKWYIPRFLSPNKTWPQHIQKPVPCTALMK